MHWIRYAENGLIDCKAPIQAMLDLTTGTPNNSTSSPKHEPTFGIVNSSKQVKEQSVELGFIEKLIELWRLRRRIIVQCEIRNIGLRHFNKYTFKAGEAIMNKTMDYRASYMTNLYKSRNREVTLNEKQQAALTCSVRKRI